MADVERTPLLEDNEEHRIGIYDGNNLSLRLNRKEQQSNRFLEDLKTNRDKDLFGRSSESDHIVAVFVVAFDTKAGNVVEWSSPDSVDLVGVEFKAMTSGSHTLHTDFVYFKKGGYFGLSCFEKIKVASDVERGARMKSVGILCTSYTLLYSHMDFLKTHVRRQLDNPGCYEQLEEFWMKKKATLPHRCEDGETSKSYMQNEVLDNMKITHPAGCFSQFINFFGENIFILWKFALLGRRIIFFSPPPIGVVCYRVYCACSLAHHQLQYQLECSDIKPYFYINVADIPTLESESAYIACTTEKIFETKTQLYDVYVDNQNIRTSSAHVKDILKVNTADRSRLQKLNHLRTEYTMAMNEGGDTNIDEEEVFATFFTDINNRILQTFLDVSATFDKTLTSDMISSLGLDPSADRTFIMELVEHYGIDVMLVADNPCCPR